MYEVDKYTVSLLHFDDVIKDETGKVWTTVGNPTILETQSKFGGKSLYLNGSSQYLATPATTDLNFSSGDFTIDWWEYRTSISDGPIRSVLSFERPIPNTNLCLVVGYLNASGHNVVYASSSGTTWDLLSDFDLGACDLNVWNHFALVRSGNTFYGFKNGILTSTFCSTSTINFTNLEHLFLGYRNYTLSNANNYFSGYIDELRISNIARWPDDGKYLLTITLAEEVEREYPVTKNELDAFIKWYDSRANGTGSVYYTFDKFLNRKDYIVYDKILTFEVTNFSN